MAFHNCQVGDNRLALSIYVTGHVTPRHSAHPHVRKKSNTDISKAPRNVRHVLPLVTEVHRSEMLPNPASKGAMSRTALGALSDMVQRPNWNAAPT
jgi:hypothetical protein